MTRLVWNETGDRRYESGVNRGVLYPSSGPGVAWNGLTAVDETVLGGELTPYYFEGLKYLDFVSGKDYQATLRAFTAPGEFGVCVGEISPRPGFILTRQPRERFGLSYQTHIEGDVGYKIHLVYNALATPSSKAYSTMGRSVSPVELSWRIDAVPPGSDTFFPTAHVVIDSTKTNVNVLSALDHFLYGNGLLEPSLPSMELLIELFTS